jgi:hypothetical protein
MSNKKKGRAKPGIIVLQKEMVFSSAFLKLSGSATQVLLYFMARRRMEKRNGDLTCTNNGEIIFPYREALSKFGVSKNRFTRAIDQLIKFGFLDIDHHGCGLAKDPSKYSVSDRWKQYGTNEFSEKKRLAYRKNTGFGAPPKKQKRPGANIIGGPNVS